MSDADYYETIADAMALLDRAELVEYLRARDESVATATVGQLARVLAQAGADAVVDYLRREQLIQRHRAVVERVDLAGDTPRAVIRWTDGPVAGGELWN